MSSRSHPNITRSQNGSSSVMIELPKRPARPAILLIKRIQISELQNRNERTKRFLPFGSNSKAKLEFSIDSECCMTTVTETKFKKKTTWSEHLTFDLSPSTKDILSVKCYDMSKGGNEGFCGEAEVRLSSYKDQKNKVNVSLVNHKKQVGRITFNIYFLSGDPPKDVDLSSHDESSSSNDKIGGVLLLKDITCKGMSKRGHLEFVLNDGAKETTEDYWKMSPEICEYAVAFNLNVKKVKLCIQCQFSALLTGFAKTKYEIKSEAWRTLMQTGTIKSGDLSFVENGFDDGSIKFRVSFHALTTFEAIIQEDTTTTTITTIAIPINAKQNEEAQKKLNEINPKIETEQITKVEQKNINRTIEPKEETKQVETSVINDERDLNENNNNQIQNNKDFKTEQITKIETEQIKKVEHISKIIPIEPKEEKKQVTETSQVNDKIDLNESNNNQNQNNNDFKAERTTKGEQKINKTIQTEPKEETKQIVETSRSQRIFNDKRDLNESNNNQNQNNKEFIQYQFEKQQSPNQSRRNTISSTTSSSRYSTRTHTSYASPLETKIVCSRYLILAPVENNVPTTRQSDQDRNQLYKGHDIYCNSDQVIIKVFARQTSWENERKFLCSLRSKYVVKWLNMEVNRSLDGFVSITSYAGDNLEVNNFLFEDLISKNQILLSISRAIEFLHGAKVAHLDLKPTNIICKPNNAYKIRLCDFESAKMFGDYLQSNYFCSYGFSAPEIVQRTDTIQASSAQDIFSLGCIFYFIHTSKRIYDNFEDFKNLTCFNHVHGDIFDERAANIMLQMLDF
ncbi:6173_t:CDS:10 [Ambispora gerdemannii]|uniref:6173_t:CDS:1 n=1 Tax=Ambispora gerdemannii TaxID=144530 RepID=A0A9N9ACX0_9GLOM|nr:6173_t:CDS:10 [Ambispora gerdemannii]